MSAIRSECLFAGGNRHPSAADWNDTHLAFGSGNNVALWTPQDTTHRGVTALLRGHTDTVNAIRFHKDAVNGDGLILSAASDNSVRIWRAVSDSKYQQIACLTDHAASVNAIAVLPDSATFVTGSADGTVRVWQLGHETRLVQAITLKPRFLPLALALFRLDQSSVVLTVAGTTAVIQIYVSHNDHFDHEAALAGHEGWIRSLDFIRETSTKGSDVLLASASQDKYVRLWRFHPGSELPALASVQDPTLGAYKGTLSNKAYYIGQDASRYSITFEALLIGHEDWIYTARWHCGDSPRLLTASADNSLTIWQREASGLWISSARLGEISAQKGATSATGSTGGFWIGLWSEDGAEVVSLGRTGSWRKWRHDTESDCWIQTVGISGHVKEVKAIAWSSDGSYLLSTGSDQTTRLFAEWKRHGSWHEMTRPQIHGYDLNCIGSLGARRFVSGADEKLLRVFDQPRAVAKLLAALSDKADDSADLPDEASVPVLGLSNKAMRDAEDEQTEVKSIEFDHPPYEDQLARHTLWPELEKLYGHGYEISALATSHDGKLVATACRASSLEHAVVRLFETADWREVKPALPAHTLTVTSLSFSSDDSFLLTVGRDRQWAVFARHGDGLGYSRTQVNAKGHTRMILDCAWAPQCQVFATAGRDKCVKIWQSGSGGDYECVTTISHELAVTAIAFDTSTSTMRLATGMEDGAIKVMTLNQSWQVGQVDAVEGHDRPSAAVNKLAWRPKTGEESETALLAACSEDRSVRIYRVSS